MTEALQSTTQASNYYDWIAALTSRHLGKRPLELGSGLGDHAARWARLPGVESITVTESSAERLALLESRFATAPHVDVLSWDDAMASKRSWTSLVGINVIEHIADDAGALRDASRHLVAGARVVMFAPAFNLLMSDWDREIGHYRRYTKRTVRDLASRAGLETLSVRYVNMPGFFAWFVGMRLMHMNTGASSGRITQRWDESVVPLARKVENTLNAPFGQSLLLVARVPNRTPSRRLTADDIAPEEADD